MTREEVNARLESVFQSVFDDDTIHIRDDMEAYEIEAWDSLGNVELIIAIELEFNIKFSMEDASSFRNVGDLINTIEKYSM